MIKNFILIFYDDKDSTYINENKTLRKDFQYLYSNLQKPFLRLTIKKLNYFYPNGKIHILSNKIAKFNYKNIIWHVDEQMPRNHLAKFKIYNLLKDPAMYLDTDIILNEKFPASASNCKNQFNMFRKYESRRLENYLRDGPISAYNAGVIWINNPSLDLQLELEEINQNVFCNNEKLLQNNMPKNCDEFALAYYCMKHKITMDLDEKISKPRFQIELKDFKKYQSVHYNKFECKLKMIKEHNKLYPAIL